MTEDIVKRLREQARETAYRTSQNTASDDTLEWEAADRIESLERKLAEAKRLESAACKRLAEYNRDLQTAEQALASALKRLAEVAEIADLHDMDIRSSESYCTNLLDCIYRIVKGSNNE